MLKLLQPDDIYHPSHNLRILKCFGKTLKAFQVFKVGTPTLSYTLFLELFYFKLFLIRCAGAEPA